MSNNLILTLNAHLASAAATLVVTTCTSKMPIDHLTTTAVLYVVVPLYWYILWRNTLAVSVDKI